MAGGGFMLFVGVLLESYALWPLARMDLAPRVQGFTWFEAHFASLMGLALLLAAPALVVMFAVDLSLGLINRFAPQLNLIGISMSLKGVAATAIWMLLLGQIVDAFGAELARRIAAILPGVQRLFAG